MTEQTTTGEITFEAPGPGEWMLDTTHHGRRPVSGYLRDLNREVFSSMETLFARYGLPLQGMDIGVVNGCDYLRPRAVGDSGKAKPPPPVWLMKIIARLHPELRRRNRVAKQAWSEKRWRQDVDSWFDADRQQVIEANRRFGAVELSALSDRELVGHLCELTDHFATQARAGFATHGGDIIPVGDYLAHCARWDIPVGEASALLRGSSPASTETARLLSPIAVALESADPWPSSVDEVGALSQECRAAVDEWLALYGWRLISSDDLDATTLAEQPKLQLQALLASTQPPTQEPPDPGPVRNRVPPEDRRAFDELLIEARYGLRLRDDNVGVRWNWPAGLIRRALLEVGRRLLAAGRLGRVEHAIEIEPGEIEPLLLRGQGPRAAELASRLQYRLDVEAAQPPSTLGDPEPPPPFDALPPAMARAARAVMTLIDAMEGDNRSSPPLHGTGIGDRAYQGRVRVVVDAVDALNRLEGGDILVAPFTGPSYNSLLPMLGGLVVDEGGPLCHAAIVAREFDIPAIIGATGATSHLIDGETVEINPLTGQITRIS